MVIGLAYATLWIAWLGYVWYTRLGRGWLSRAAAGLTLVSWLLFTVGLAQRAAIAGHWPLTSRYEFALVWVWAISLVYLLLEASWQERRAAPFALGIGLLVASYAITRPALEQAIYPLLPALRSNWLQVHVLSSAIGYGLCAVAAGLGLARLMGSQSTLAAGAERNLERCVALAFPWLTLAILSGAVWAQQAWGRYWGWDIKETWSLVAWLWYLIILHLAPVRRWRGRRLAGLALVGLAILLFNFVGVPWLVRTVRLESLHGF